MKLPFPTKLLPLLLFTLLVACTTVSPLPTGSGAAWTRDEMYFGLLRPNGGAAITEQEWENFIETVVTPRFPAGLTVFNGAGQWRTAAGHIEREPSKVLVILHPSTESLDAKIDEVRKLYCERFNQEAVMRVTSPARVAF